MGASSPVRLARQLVNAIRIPAKRGDRSKWFTCKNNKQLKLQLIENIPRDNYLSSGIMYLRFIRGVKGWKLNTFPPFPFFFLYSSIHLLLKNKQRAYISATVVGVYGRWQLLRYFTA